jgi:hypothetical protein
MALYRRDGVVTLNAPTYTNLGGISVYVCNQPSNANQANPLSTVIPPAPLATVYANEAGAPLANPVITDGNGHYYFYAAPGLYDIVIADPTLGRIYPVVTLDQPIGVASGGSGASGVVSVGVASSSLAVANSPITVSGNINVNLPTVNPGQVLGLPSSASGPGTAQPFTLPSPTGVALETNGILNTDQLLLNLKAGTNVTLSADGVGGVTVDAAIPSGAGTVTSVGFVGDGILFSSTPITPITTSGVITPVLNAVPATYVYAGPTSGSPAVGTLRQLTASDISGLTVVALETNGTTNTNQTLLNLKAGTNITLTADGSGGVTVSQTSAGGTGTVTSVGVSVPSFLSVSGTPVTASGTIAIASASGLNSNWVLATPNGVPGVLSPRALTGADLPYPTASTTGGVQSFAAQTSKWINTISVLGVPSATQPTFSDVAGSITIAQIGATGTPSNSTYLRGDGTWNSPAGAGTVTSVAMTVPSWLTVSGSPITAAGTLAVTATGSLTANSFLATPNGSSGALGVRAIVGADLPTPSSIALGGVQSYATVSHQWINTISTAGVPSSSQPAFSDISGTVSASQLPTPTATTLGGVESISVVSHNFLTGISTAGVPTQAQPAFTDISGTVASGQLPSRTGAIQASINGAGSVPATGVFAQIIIPVACTITAWDISADQSGSATVAIGHSTTGAFPTPTSLGSATLSTQQRNSTGSLSWAVNAGDYVYLNLSAVTTCTKIFVTLTCSIPWA